MEDSHKNLGIWLGLPIMIERVEDVQSFRCASTIGGDLCNQRSDEVAMPLLLGITKVEVEI